MDSPGKPSFIERVAALLSREPEDRDDLFALLQAAFERDLLDADALSIIEGALQVADMQAHDVMVPRAQMDCVRLDSPVEDIAGFVVDTGHSRFPVIGGGKDDIVGILLAKDLLRHFAGREFDLPGLLRPAVFIPESKRLNVLLREFRASHNHMAIVVDEYGGVAGLVTIEDVLEQIVGEIEDEHDLDDSGDNIRLAYNGRYRVKATTAIEDFNKAFSTEFCDDEYETVGGLLMRRFGRLPQRGDTVELAGLRFQVLRADSRRLHSVLVDVLPPLPSSSQAGATDA